MLLLAVRLADALIDPLLGQMVDALGRQKNTYRKPFCARLAWVVCS